MEIKSNSIRATSPRSMLKVQNNTVHQCLRSCGSILTTYHKETTSFKLVLHIKKKKWIKYRDIQTTDEHKLLGLLHPNWKKKLGTLNLCKKQSELQELCEWKSRSGPVGESRGSLSCAKHHRQEPAWRPTPKGCKCRFTVWNYEHFHLSQND